MTESRSSVLITVDELAAQTSGKAGLIILDVSDDLETAPLERPVIPGAIAVSLASDFSGPATKSGGRRPLPDAGVLQENLRRWGMDSDSPVVVYDNASGAQAGRAWWTVRWAGHANVRLLDGGLAAWKAAGHDTAAQPSRLPGPRGPATSSARARLEGARNRSRCRSQRCRTPPGSSRSRRRCRRSGFQAAAVG